MRMSLNGNFIARQYSDVKGKTREAFLFTLPNLDFNQVDWLHKPGTSSQLASVQGTSSGRNNLTTTPVDGVSVQSNIINVEPNTAQIFVAQSSLQLTN